MILRTLVERINAVSEGTYWVIFAAGMAAYGASVILSIPVQLEVFARDAWQIPMFRIMLFLGFYAPAFAFNPRRRAGRDAVVCMLLMLLAVWLMDYKDDVRLNNALIAPFVPEWFARVTLDLVNPVWAMVLVLISLPALLAVNWMADRRVGGKGGREYQLNAVLSNGILVYFVLSLTIWVATHFVYVAGLSFYMRGYQRFIDQTTRVLDRVDRHERLPLKGLVHVKSEHDVEEHFRELHERTRADRKAVVTDAHSIWRMTLQHGEDYIVHPKSVSESKNFFDFLEAVFNHRFDGYRDGVFWFSRISGPADYDREIVKLFFVYVRPSQAGGYWVFSEFSRDFKERRQGSFVTQFYMLFQIVFPLLLTWLWMVHRRRLAPKSVASEASSD